jgi:hypothetical protein
MPLLTTFESPLLSEVNTETSFFAVNWRFLFNLRVRNRDYRAPNFLVYYAFTGDGRGLRVIGGPQSDSHSLLAQAWTSDMHEGYFKGAQRLREFIDLVRGG